MNIQYLEIVTPDVGAVCASLAATQGLTFSDPVEVFGNARIAEVADGKRIGVRAPMHDDEAPATRPYYLTEDIEAATQAAEAAGAMIAHPPMEMPGQGTFSILFQGGIEYGFWQL